MPTQFLLSRIATFATVPLPMNGSRTIPPSGHPALMHRSGIASGNVAKWAPEYGWVAIVQTVRMFLDVASFALFDPIYLSKLFCEVPGQSLFLFPFHPV